ncbi:MAG TPA: LON peptidase substrate-binding domain-containing protein [Pirellulales bacterium]|nr:LON peptidase substrate-binding domain-containing protein [Pirellulales bacterium]
MGPIDDIAFSAAEFSGRARLFPLPNLVMFPHVLQPLHVFEPRYRDMVEEALAGDRLITMAILAPGWEADYEGRPPLLPIACLGRIASHQRLEDGRFNLLLAGLRRVRLLRELPPDKLFREAEVEILDDLYGALGGGRRPILQRRLVEVFREQTPNLKQLHEQLDQIMESEVPLGMLTDILAFTLKLTTPVKEQLLAETDVDRRAERLLETLQAGGTATETPAAKFPPDFSAN